MAKNPFRQSHKMTATGEPAAREDSSAGGPPAIITTPTTILAPSPTPVHSDVPMPNANGSGNGSGSHKSTIVIESQPKRRVSIISDPPVIGGGGSGYDNPAYEQNPRRKISQVRARVPCGC